jgi:imidazolonepropionase-like amidohydrolase
MTSVNAELLQNPDIGCIVAGSAGDAVLLDGNPFEDPSVLWDETRPRLVIQGGRAVV